MAEDRLYVELLRKEVRILELTLKMRYGPPGSPLRQESRGLELQRLTEEFARSILTLAKKPHDRQNVTEQELLDRNRRLRVHPGGYRHTHEHARNYLEIADGKIEGKRNRKRLDKAMDRYDLGYHPASTAASLVCHYLVCRWLDEHEEERKRYRTPSLRYYDVLDLAEQEYLGWPPFGERRQKNDGGTG